jgi:hypothetical protein
MVVSLPQSRLACCSRLDPGLVRTQVRASTPLQLIPPRLRTGSHRHVAATLPLFSRGAAVRQPASPCTPYSAGLKSAPTRAVGDEAEVQVEFGEDDPFAVDADSGDAVVGRGILGGAFGIVPSPDPLTRRVVASSAIDYGKLSQPASLTVTMIRKAPSEEAFQAGKSNRAELRAAASRARIESKATVATANAEASRIPKALSGLESLIRTMAAHTTSGKVPDEAVAAIAAAAAQCVPAC